MTMTIDPDASELAALYPELTIVAFEAVRFSSAPSATIPAHGALDVMDALSVVYPSAPFSDIERMASDMLAAAWRRGEHTDHGIRVVITEARS